METNFSTDNFLEPTDKFKEEFFDANDIKGYFNADLICYASYYENALKTNNLEELEYQFNQFNLYSEFYNLKYSYMEIYERFKDYPKVDFNELMKHSMPNYIKEDN